jgi:hypothetical protein
LTTADTAHNNRHAHYICTTNVSELYSSEWLGKWEVTNMMILVLKTKMSSRL